MTIDIDKLIEEMRERELIRCPYCDAIYDDEEYDCVSYYGTSQADGPYECECGYCEETFFVAERVDREYTSGKTVEDARGY